jgi:CRISPR-associated endonuclease Csn1
MSATTTPMIPSAGIFATVSKLKLRRARRVRIDELGRVHTIPHGTI